MIKQNVGDRLAHPEKHFQNLSDIGKWSENILVV
jgi:hypothetical protein